ncbi:Caleosin related protein-domain-containing protein [Thamnidium elegans]|nr:Caleosin related protein-domain-containing protein [Thamnidium elegans]
MSLFKASNTSSKMSEREPAEESGIQKHVKFWDRKHKGYITPLDTISGFITLGYSTLFSIAVGAFVGIFLSISTQKGWFPDPLCRSNVRNLIRSKKETQCNQGAYDANGLFVPEKFDSLFSKYANSDKSGKTITVAELIRMTQEQERLGKDVKAWATCMIELSTAYFFIGHRGYLTKEDVRSAYDGTLFYRLRDTHRLMIKQGSVANIDSTGPGLGGSYLASSHGLLSPRGIENRVQNLLHALQSKSSALVSDKRLRGWVSYVQEGTESIKNSSIIPRGIISSPSSIIRGVTTPKASMYRSSKHEDPATLFPEGLTGVAKPESMPTDPKVLNTYLRKEEDDTISTKEAQHSDINEQTYIRITNEKEPVSHFIDDSFVAPKPQKSVSTITSHSLFQDGFLKDETDDWPNQGLTGVKNGNTKRPASSISSSSLSPSSSGSSEVGDKCNMDVSSKNVAYIPTTQSPPPPQLIQEGEVRSIEVPTSVITPPPDEKPVTYVAPSNINNKKTKSKSKKGKPGQTSPTGHSESGQETHTKERNPIATDAK